MISAKTILFTLVFLAPAAAMAQPAQPMVDAAPAATADSSDAAAAAMAPAEPMVDAAPAAAADSSDAAWTIGVAPRMGLTVPTSALGPMAVGGLELDVVLPVAGRRLVLALDVSLTRPSSSGSASDMRIGGAGDYDLDVTELKVGLDVIFRLFGPGSRLVPFVGLGPVVHMLRTVEVTTFAPGENLAQDTELGFELLAGADFRAGPGFVLGEARVVYSNLEHLFTGDSNAGNVMASVGYRLVF